MGFDNMVDSLWNPNSERYKVLCRTVHVTKAALHVGYIQLLFCFIFIGSIAYNYGLAVTGYASNDSWMNQYIARYTSQLLLAISLHVIIVVAMIHGIRTDRKSLLVPYIIFTTVTVLVGMIQIMTDFMVMDRNLDASELQATSSLFQFFGHVIATMIQAWFLGVVWRCYGFIGEKKVAQQIKDQLESTRAAFFYPGQPFYQPQSQPPPYNDTIVISAPLPSAAVDNSQIKGTNRDEKTIQ